VRLSALGYGEGGGRRGVMGYYELARECRENAVRSDVPDEEKKVWKARLRDCGVRVANVLVEMGDLAGAGRHLGTLGASSSSSSSSSDEGQMVTEIKTMEILTWLRVGDIASAQRCLSALSTTTSTDSSLSSEILTALIHLANSDFPTATQSFRDLHIQYPEDAMIATNLAVCLVYTGHISEAKTILEKQVDSSAQFHSLVFNLSTVYELCTERNREMKMGLAEKLAARKGGDGVGWEIGVVGFKMQVA
jgi:Flp pilus assembly protein TadD